MKDMLKQIVKEERGCVVSDYILTKLGLTDILTSVLNIRPSSSSVYLFIQSDTKKRELLKNPTKMEEIQEKNLLTEI